MESKIRTHPRVVRFLDLVCAHVRGKSRKLEVREEILSHLEAELEETDTGLDESVARALEKFGDPETLGRSLRMAHRTWLRRLAAFSMSSLALGTLLVYFFSVYFFHHYNDVLERMNSKVSSRIPRFEADQKSLATLDFLRETAAVHADAGSYLNARIHWGREGRVAAIQVPDVSNPLWNNDWMSADIPAELEKIDLSWMKRLEAFDHWDLFTSGPNAHFIGVKPELVNPYLIPFPDFAFLPRAARLRLRRGLDLRDAAPALREVRQLARLSYTTETLIGSMVAVGLLKMERAAYDEAVRRNILLPADYEAVDPILLKKMKTTLWATVGFADSSAPDVVKRAFLGKDAWPVGACAALGETAQQFVLGAEFLQKKYPLEVDLEDRIAVVHQVLRKSRAHCRLVFHRQLVDRYRDYANVMIGPASFSLASGWIGRFENVRFSYGRHIPYIRQGLGMELLAIARPDFSGLYERE